MKLHVDSHKVFKSKQEHQPLRNIKTIDVE